MSTLTIEIVRNGRPVSLKDIEQQVINAAIDTCEGNLTLAAKALGIGRSTLYRRIREWKEEHHDAAGKD